MIIIVKTNIAFNFRAEQMGEMKRISEEGGAGDGAGGGEGRQGAPDVADIFLVQLVDISTEGEDTGMVVSS